MSTNHIILAALCLLLCLSAVRSDDTEGDRSTKLFNVEGSLRIPRTAKPSRARVYLNGGKYSAIVTKTGQFVIPDVPVGSYLLEASHPEYSFQLVRIDISGRLDRVKASLARSKTSLRYPLTLSAEPAKYFQEHVPYDWSGIFKNPMALMMIFTVFMAFGLPKLMENMDPKELEEMRRGMQKAPAIKRDRELQ